MTNFQKVVEFNELGGNAKGCAINKDNIVDEEKFIAQLKLIEEEFNELRDAESISDVRDAIADMLVTTYGMAHVLRLDADKDMEIVCDSNISKFCKDEEEARMTQQKYDLDGLSTFIRMPAVISSKDQYNKYGKYFPKGKILKSIYFKEPQFK